MEKIQFNKLKKLLVRYIEKNSTSFNQPQKDLSDELSNKINDLEQYSNKITELTNRLTNTGGSMDISFDPKTETVNFGPIKLRLNRADPSTRIQIDNITKAYPKKIKSPLDANTKALEGELEKLAVSFYQTAHRVCNIAKNLPGLERFDCRGIRIIRNNLIEHPEGRGSGIIFDSFAYSKNEGPFIKGLRMNNQTKFMDNGFKYNCQEFINKLEDVIFKVLG